MLRREITDDGIRFPEDESVVLDGRHEAIGIAAPVLRRVDDSKRPASIDALVVKPDFLAAPEHFLDVDRAGPAPYLEHALPTV
jgi:hypothetical protein